MTRKLTIKRIFTNGYAVLLDGYQRVGAIRKVNAVHYEWAVQGSKGTTCKLRDAKAAALAAAAPLAA